MGNGSNFIKKIEINGLKFHQLSKSSRNIFGNYGIFCLGKNYENPLFLFNGETLEQVECNDQKYENLQMAALNNLAGIEPRPPYSKNRFFNKE